MKKVSISVAERDSGISKDTLRVWEKRYGFPLPLRDDQGNRCYDAAQIEQLRLIKRLIDGGMRPSKVVGLAPDALQALAMPVAETPADAALQSDDALALLQASDLNGLREHMSRALLSAGLNHFVSDYVAPLNAAVGDAWSRGTISIAQEHLYTEELSRLLRSSLQAIKGTPQGPRVLLTTLPGEQHSLGLLMAEVVMRTHGADTIPIGTEVPLAEICTAARAHACNAVALSFSQARNTAFVTDGVDALRALLDRDIELWIGGLGAARLKRTGNDVQLMRGLDDVAVTVDRWRPPSAGPRR